MFILSVRGVDFDFSMVCRYIACSKLESNKFFTVVSGNKQIFVTLYMNCLFQINDKRKERDHFVKINSSEKTTKFYFH